MKMKSFVTCLVCFAVLAGCTKTYWWVKDGSSMNDFNRSKSYCDRLSSAATPIDTSYPNSSTTYVSGSVLGTNGSYGTYSGTSTTVSNNQNQIIANTVQIITRQNLFNDCMRDEGWELEERTRSNWFTNMNKFIRSVLHSFFFHQ